MVNPEPHLSRAATLTLVGGDLALDFANTCSGRGDPDRREHLQSAEAIVAWAAHARVVDPSDANHLNAALHCDPRLARRIYEETLSLRETIYELYAALAAREPAPRDAIDRLSAVHSLTLGKGRVAPIGGHFAWNWRTSEAPVEALLGPISLSALTLLLQADLTRIKQCHGDKCGWLFLDTTKNKSRRWCEMEVCGNRAKQKRHAVKAREA